MNKWTPMVSIAIPVFNGSNYLRDAINSLISQTYPNCEILVINDGSRDQGKTEEIAHSYGDKIRYYYKENGGVASALNFALSVACGEYFCWLSHDDIYLPNKIESEFEVIRSLSNKNAIIYCYHGFMDVNGNYLHDAPNPPNFTSNQAAYYLILNQWLHGCTIIAPKILFLESGGFREDLPTTQDYDLLVKMGLKYPYIGVPKILLYARSHPEQGSLTLSHNDEVEAFFNGHIPMLTPEYMHSNFNTDEIIQAFIKLGEEMHRRKYPQAIIATSHQLTLCVKEQVSADFLWAVLMYLLVELYGPISSISHENGSKIRAFSNVLKKDKLFSKIFNLLPLFIAKRCKLKLKRKSIDFDSIYATNAWKGGESRSGQGSNLYQTRIIREEIPNIIKRLGIQHLLDVPCGDWRWMQYVDLGGIQYTGGDIVKKIVDINKITYSDKYHSFIELNIITGPIPYADMILCRDCLVHLNFSDGLSAIEQFRKSGAKWLLCTTFTSCGCNKELFSNNDGWRPINLEIEPYNLSKANYYLYEGCTENNETFSDKALGLWRINE